MPEQKKSSILEETFAEIATIKEALTNNASTLLNGNLKDELQDVVADAIAESTKKEKTKEKIIVKEGFGDENPELEDDETVPSSDTGDVSGELSNDVVGDELPPTDDVTPMDAEMPTDEVPPIETPDELGDEIGAELGDEIVDLTGASDDEVLKVFKKMGPEDEIEVVQSTDGDIELKVGGEEYYIKTDSEITSDEPEVTDIVPDADLEPATELVAEGSHTEELARVKKMGGDSGNVDASRREDVKTPKEEGVAKVGEKSNINTNQDESSDKRDDVKNPAEKDVAEQNKSGEDIDGNVKKNFEHGKNDKRTDVPKPTEIGVAEVKEVPSNISGDASTEPNYDRGTKSTPEKDVAIVTDKTTVGIAENAEQLKGKLDENHKKLVYTRQKYAEVIADNATLRDNIETLNESADRFKADEEDYKTAIITLKEQFGEVALFTSNLTYAVKLMTEHATTKDEKNQILERFDGAKSLEESKVIYESLGANFEKPTKTATTIDEQLNKTVASGASTINESTAYKSPDLTRMLDLMNKI